MLQFGLYMPIKKTEIATLVHTPTMHNIDGCMNLRGMLKDNGKQFIGMAASNNLQIIIV